MKVGPKTEAEKLKFEIWYHLPMKTCGPGTLIIYYWMGLRIQNLAGI